MMRTETTSVRAEADLQREVEMTGLSWERLATARRLFTQRLLAI